jgi:multiple sugar transport system permease protein
MADVAARMPAGAPRRRAGFERFGPYGLIAPALILIAVVSFAPMIYAVIQSLHRSDYMNLGDFVGLENYVLFLVGEGGLRRVWNSFVFVGGSLLLTLPLGFGLAVVLNQPGLPFRNTFRTLLILPWLISGTVAALLWAWILNSRFGPLAPIASSLGFEMTNPLTDQTWAMVAIILCNVWGSYPLVMVFVLAALQTVPRDLHEAARIDGANGWQRFLHVTLPIVKNTTLVTLVLTTLNTFNNVTVVLILTGGGPVGATDVMAFQVFTEGFKFFRMGVASAGALFIFAINVAFTIAYLRVLRGPED